MICSTCDLDLAHCICVRLPLELDPQVVIQVVCCTTCGRHFSRCVCEAPVLEPRSAA